MERIEIYGKFCRSWEGGWYEDPKSDDGPKMSGVTYKTLCDFRKAKKQAAPTKTDLRNISVAEWNEVLRWSVWNRIKADKIKDESVAYLIADCVWMSGLDYVKNVQSTLGVKADGIIGPVTLGKINEKEPDKLFNKLWEQREKYLNELAQEGNNKSLLKGWLNRLNSIKYGCLCNNSTTVAEKMEKIEKYGKFCRSWEGGWSNHPKDPGGATMKGVTYKTFCNYRKAKNLPKPTLTELRNITIGEWTEVLRWGYWDRIKADEIKDEWVTYLLMDCVWMSGTGYMKKVQTLLELTADGVVGKKTLAKINSIDGKKLFNMLWQMRERNFRYIARGDKKVFLKGWLNRLNCVQYGFLCCNGGTRLN